MNSNPIFVLTIDRQNWSLKQAGAHLLTKWKLSRPRKEDLRTHPSGQWQFPAEAYELCNPVRFLSVTPSVEIQVKIYCHGYSKRNGSISLRLYNCKIKLSKIFAFAVSASSVKKKKISASFVKFLILGPWKLVHSDYFFEPLTFSDKKWQTTPCI